MNKILIFFILCSFTLAQKADLTSAILAFQKNDNAAAKEFIDIAYDKFMQKGIDQEKPKIVSKFWYNRGEIYYALGDFDVATESFINDLNLNAKGGLQKKSVLSLQNCAAQFYNLAYENYESENFLISAKYFEKTYEIKSHPSIGVLDTTSLYSACVVYSRVPDFLNSNRIAKNLISINSKEDRYHIQLISSLKGLEKKDELLSAINFARNEIPSSIDFMYEEVDFYLEKGDNEGLISSLDNAIKVDPNNPILYFVLGQTSQDLGKLDIAEESYLKAINIDSDYFNAYNNLASIYVNQTVSMTEEMNSLGMSSSDQKKYEQIVKKRTSLYAKAVPYLENCIRIEPNNLDALRVLKEVYYALDDTDSFMMIRKKIAELESN